MKPAECTEIEFVLLVWGLILSIISLAMYSLELVIGFLSEKYAVGQINNIYALVVAVLFILIIFFGLVFLFYKVYCKKAEDEIEQKRLEILEKTRIEYAGTKK